MKIELFNQDDDPKEIKTALLEAIKDDDIIEKMSK